MGKEEIIYWVKLEKLVHCEVKNKTGLLPNNHLKGELQMT